MSFVLTAILMFIFWMLLSGDLHSILVISGIISSLLVAYWSHDLIFGKADLRVEIGRILRFIKYLPWLFWQIILSNIDLTYRTLHPSKPISPRIISFKNDLKTDMGRVTLANSITLTPGTITIEVSKDEFVVHAIGKEAADSLLSGEMQSRIKKIEGDAEDV